MPPGSQSITVAGGFFVRRASSARYGEAEASAPGPIRGAGCLRGRVALLGMGWAT
jgi:hypothetical protein